MSEYPILEELEQEIDQQLNTSEPAVVTPEEETTQITASEELPVPVETNTDQSDGIIPETIKTWEPLVATSLAHMSTEEKQSFIASLQDACSEANSYNTRRRIHKVGIPSKVSETDLGLTESCNAYQDMKRIDLSDTKDAVQVQDKAIKITPGYRPAHYYPKAHLVVELVSERALTEPEWINTTLNVDISSGMTLFKSNFHIKHKEYRSNKATVSFEFPPNYGPPCDISGKMLDVDESEMQYYFSSIVKRILNSMIKEKTTFQVNSIKIDGVEIATWKTKLVKIYHKVTRVFSFKVKRIERLHSAWCKDRQTVRVGSDEPYYC